MASIRLRCFAALLLGLTALISPARAAPAMGTLKLECETKGALVSVDGINVGLTPLKPLPLLAGPHRLKVAKAGKLNVDQKFQIVGGKTSTVQAGASGADLDLDLDLAPVAATAGKKKPKTSDLDLDLDLPAPVTTQSKKGKGKESAKGKPAAPPPAPSGDDLDLALMAPEADVAPAPVEVAASVARPAPAPAAPAFVVDPIAQEAAAAALEPSSHRTPLHRNTWLWTGVIVAVAAGVAVPLVMMQTSSYEERRSPTDICRDCLVVMNK